MQKAVFIGADPQVAEIVRLGTCLRWPDVTSLIATTGASGLERKIAGLGASQARFSG